MQLTVTGCRVCPFANNDNEYGLDACNLADSRAAGPDVVELIGRNGFSLVPDDVHWKPHNCPLLTAPATLHLVLPVKQDA